MRQHIEIVGGKDIRAALVLKHGHGLVRTLELRHRILPAAGLRAGAAIAPAPGQIIAHHAPTRVRHAHGPMHKSFQLHPGIQPLTQAGNARQRQLAGQHNALRAKLSKQVGRFRIHHIRLRAYM